jgi:hypothetical protein
MWLCVKKPSKYIAVRRPKTSRGFVIALNYSKGEARSKGGIRRKQKKAALDETWLAGTLAV